MTQTHLFPENDLWKNKAFAFLVRARQDLWGKHNEDMMAWIFKKGFSNQFARDMLFGLNKYPKTRPAANWGLAEDMDDILIQDGKLTLPPGLVIPYLVDKDLRKLIFYDYQSTQSRRSFPLPGGSSEPMLLGKSSEKTAVVFNIIQALLVYQELGDDITIIIPHNEDSPDDQTLDLINKSMHCLVFPDPMTGQNNPWPSQIDASRCHLCSNPSDIITLFH